MKTLQQIACDSTKSIMEREMAYSRMRYPRKKKLAIADHSKRMNIDIHESEQYYDFVSQSKCE